MAAFENAKVPAWAMFNGKEAMYSYNEGTADEASDALEAWLMMLQEGNSDAAYTLRMYKNPPAEITNLTPYNYSFKFKLFSDEQSGGYSALRSVKHDVYERLAKLEKEKEEKEEEDEGEKVGGIQGALIGMLQRPDVQDFFVNNVVGMIGRFFNKGTTGPAAVAGLPDQPAAGTAAELYNKMSEEERGLMDAAMVILMDKDPKVGTHLYKLACILRDSPSKYNMYAAML